MHRRKPVAHTEHRVPRLTAGAHLFDEEAKIFGIQLAEILLIDAGLVIWSRRVENRRNASGVADLRRMVDRLVGGGECGLEKLYRKPFHGRLRRMDHARTNCHGHCNGL